MVDAVDITSDWLLYHDVAYTRTGLVFGPFDNKLVVALLVACCLGSVILVVEVIVMALDTWKEKLNLLVVMDIMTFISIWFEEVPQMLINCIIVACRDEAISIFQVICQNLLIIKLVYISFRIKQNDLSLIAA